VDPAHTDEEVEMVAFGAAIIVTSLFPDDVLQPPLFVTFTASVTDPDVKALYVMLFVPPPDVITPLDMVHTYLAPLPALVTKAVLLFDPAHTVDAAVMVAAGYATIETSLLPDEALHPVVLVTVTARVTEPDAPAV